jgi:hypothetical protein
MNKPINPCLWLRLFAATFLLFQASCMTIVEETMPSVKRLVRWLGLYVLLFANNNAKALARQIPALADSG